MTTETREVLGDAYCFGPRNQKASMLTHAVMVDVYGSLVAVLCRRVSIDSLADRNAGNDVTAEPTCVYCRRALKKRNQPRGDQP